MRATSLKITLSWTSLAMTFTARMLGCDGGVGTMSPSTTGGGVRPFPERSPPGSSGISNVPCFEEQAANNRKTKIGLVSYHGYLEQLSCQKPGGEVSLNYLI